MSLSHTLKSLLIAGASIAAITSANAEQFDIPAGDLKSALDSYASQTGTQMLISTDAVKGVRTRGVQGDMGADAALSRLLSGTGFKSINTAPGAIGLVPTGRSSEAQSAPMQFAQAAPVPRSSVETVTVTSSKLGSQDVQTVPIAISAFSQEQLTATQTAGGPDLVKSVPNLTFSKTNFTGYNIQIRGIGTQAISVTTDPAVAVAFNDVPFIRNHFFEQEFFDVAQVEVLRGPQGTLYGRNATAGVVNLSSAKPTDQYEAMGSVDVGNYNNRRLEGMLNIPIADDKLGLRLAGEWTKRDGYTYNSTLNRQVDGRNLWSGRATLGFKPVESLQAYLIWEHFSEKDDRLRSGKALCHRDTPPDTIDGPLGPQPLTDANGGLAWLSQGCKAGSLYDYNAFGTPVASGIPFVAAAQNLFRQIPFGLDPYGGVIQSPSLREIGSALLPSYTAKNDTVEFNVDFKITPALTLTSQTGYSKDSLYSTQDFNRFSTIPNVFAQNYGEYEQPMVGHDGEYCDPQLGCSSTFVGQDVSRQKSEQFSQELRLSSKFEGPFNFSLGANYLQYRTKEDYFVFFNVLTMMTEVVNHFYAGTSVDANVPHFAFDGARANNCGPVAANFDDIPFWGLGCAYIDPNPLDKIDGDGHNYFRSHNPYKLHSWAGFGEAYYQVTDDIKLTGGLRWTYDSKSFEEFPSWALVAGSGYPSAGFVDQSWKEWTGRFNVNWTPKLDFTDQTMVYASYSRGYKGGGANPPGVVPFTQFGYNYSSPSVLTHPLTFKPEFVDALELGSKNSLLDGALTLNASAFYYDYKNYQISEIVDRTSVNLNFNAKVRGAEIEAVWEPLPGLRFNFAGGYENATLNKGSQSIDLMDRTAGHQDWMVVKPFITQTSNCILPRFVVNHMMTVNAVEQACFFAYSFGYDPFTQAPYDPNPSQVWFPGYHGWSADQAPAEANHGEGFAKDLSGNKLPNTPPFTASFGAQYSMPISETWAGTLRSDFYWQDSSYARIFNDRPYDSLHAYTNVNLAVILTNQDGWQVMTYVKNVFDTTAITGAFLNSDDTALTTNVFVTDPRLFGIRITKNW